MSKSKKNTIDPEEMIKKYGADAVRWFILSDSPPEKDIQWSDNGVASANKFLQRMWNLTQSIINITKQDVSKNKKTEESFTNKINNYVYKIDLLINKFQFNVAIANFYEVYKVFNSQMQEDISRTTMIENFEKIIRILIPFIPHLANECLQSLNSNKFNQWPKIKIETLKNPKTNIVIQTNGKTRDVVQLDKDMEEEKIVELVSKETKVKKFLEGKSLIKHIYIKNKLINFVIK